MGHQPNMQYDSPIKNQVVGARKAGQSLKSIANQFEMPLPSVSSILRRYCQRGTTHNAPRSGRPPKLTPRTQRLIIRIMKKNRYLPYRELRKQIHPKLHPDTISRCLWRHNFHRRRARIVPILTHHHRKLRMAWAQHVKKWQIFQWRRIIWTDECYVHLTHAPGTIYVTRTPKEAELQECMLPKFHQSPVRVMVWGCISYGWKGQIVVLDYPGGKGGGMTAERYQEQVLDAHVLDFYTQRTLAEGSVWLQHDGARCHRCPSTKAYLARNGIKTFPHPPSSPDISPIENIWWEMKKGLQARQRTPTSKKELIQAVKEEWAKIPISVVNKYILSMPCRVHQIIRNHGGNTTY
jgi:hypothetical protein